MPFTTKTVRRIESLSRRDAVQKEAMWRTGAIQRAYADTMFTRADAVEEEDDDDKQDEPKLVLVKDDGQEQEAEREMWHGVASNMTMDQHGTVIHTDGIDVTRFMTNPIMYYDHGYASWTPSFPLSMPIGAATKLDRSATELLIDFFIARGTAERPLEPADTVRQLMAQSVLRALSIGFDVVDVELEEKSIDVDGQTFTLDIPHIIKSLLFEVSVVGLPSNPETLVGKSAGANVVSYPNRTALCRALAGCIVEMMNKGDDIDMLRKVTLPIVEHIHGIDARKLDQLDEDSRALNDMLKLVEAGEPGHKTVAAYYLAVTEFGM